jgi:antitoxin (DNA-binding transcriptional repressor) of toxin-antitoxin stability system
MEVTITQFRRNLFELVDSASSGTDVWFIHKGKRFRIVPEEKPPSKLSRITPMPGILVDMTEEEELAIKRDIQIAWEADWEDL